MGLDKFEGFVQGTTSCAIPKGVGIVSTLVNVCSLQQKETLKTSSSSGSRTAVLSNGLTCDSRQSRKIKVRRDRNVNELPPREKKDWHRVEGHIRCCARGRPRRKTARKSGGNQNDENGKKSRDDKGEQKDTRSNRGGNSGRGNGGNDDDRGKKDDDNEDDNEDDDEDENNDDGDEDAEEEENNKKEVSSCDVWSINEKNRENEESVLEDMLRLVPSADLNCEPPELPARPGSLVNLHGVVVHETAGGLVILNVRWRNKVYSGAFIDIKKNRWPADRLDEEIPTNGNSFTLNGKEDPLSRKLNGKKGKKTSEELELGNVSRKKASVTGIGSEPLKSSPSKQGKRLADQGSSDSSENEKNKKKTRIVEKPVPVSPSSPPFIECPEPNCDKRYRHVNGLKYHQAHAHQCKPENKDEEIKTPLKRPSADQNKATESQTFDSNCGSDGLIKVECIKKEEEDYSVETIPKKDATSNVEIKTEKEFYSDSFDAVSASGDSVIVDVENTGLDNERPRCTPSISVENVAEDKDDKSSEKSCESIDSCGRLKPDRINLMTGEGMYSLLPLMPPYFPSYLQHSPTLGSLNPQTLNNSLSSALQTSREIEGKNEEIDSNQSSTLQGKINQVALDNLKEYEKGLAQYAFSNQLLARTGKLMPRQGVPVMDDIVIASDEENTSYSPEVLPGLQDSVLARSLSNSSDTGYRDLAGKGNQNDCYPGRSETSDVSSKQEGVSPRRIDVPVQFKPGQPQSIISSALFQQLSQERLNTQLQDLGNTNTSSDLAAPADIQQALSKVDIRRHFSPMLLNYLKPCRGDVGLNGEELDGQDGKRDSNGNRADYNDKLNSDKPTMAMESKPNASSSGNKLQQAFAVEDSKGPLASIATGQLQPNISIGRPISRPVQKPDSITGGSASSSKFRDDPRASVSKDKAFTKVSKEIAVNSPPSELYSDVSVASPHSLSKDTVKNEPLPMENMNQALNTESSSWAKASSSLPPTSSKSSEGQQPLTSSSAPEKNMVEAKTWIPQGLHSAAGGRTVEGEYMGTDLRKQQASDTDSKDRPKIIAKGLPAISSPPHSMYGLQCHPGESQTTPGSFGIFASKNLGNARGALPVPIAPAPVSKGNETQRSQEKIENDSTARDVPQISRFTLTSDNRLVPSPAESRGRPRKVRVEKTQQIPIGTAHDVEVISRIEERPRKQQQQTSSGNIVRASVIHSMAPSTTPQKTTFSSKEMIPGKDSTAAKPKPVIQERIGGNQMEKNVLPVDYKRRPSFESHSSSSQEKRQKIESIVESKTSPDLERERSKFKSLAGESSHSSHRMEDRLNDMSTDDKRYGSSSRPSSTHSLGRGPSSKDDTRGKFPSSSTPLPSSLSSDIGKTRTPLSESYLGLPTQFVGQFSAAQRMHPGIPYPGLYLNPPFPRELLNDPMGSCLPPGLRDDLAKGIGSSGKDRFDREKARSPGESSLHSIHDLTSPREHGLPHHLAKQHSSLPGYGKSTPDPLRMSRDALRTSSRTREQSPIFLGSHNAPGDPARALRPSPDSGLSRNIPERPLYGGGPQYLAQLSPSLLGRLRPDGPPDITSRQGQGRIHESLLDSGRLRRDFNDTSSHPSAVNASNRPTYLPQHSQSAGPALYPENLINRSTSFGLRSSNLILSRADGAIVGPLPFDGRQADSNKR